MKSVFFIGECMVELQRGSSAANASLSGAMTDTMQYRFGGDTLNTAVYFSRLTDHALFDPTYVSALGSDTLSCEMQAMWQREGINTQWVQCLPDKLPGMYLIETDAGGERHFHFWRNDSAARYWLQSPGTPAVCAALAKADAIYLSGISLAILSPQDRQELCKVLADCRQHGGKIIFDNNYRPLLWQNPAFAKQAYQQVLQLADIALLTLDDENLLYGTATAEEAIARTSALGVKEIVIKRGAQSCLVSIDGMQHEIAPLRVTTVVDTTAAGDSFGAAYIAARLSGKNAVDAASAGHRLASVVIQHRGAIIPQYAMP